MSYKESQQLIFEAEAAMNSGDAVLARTLFLKAAVLQKDMLSSVPDDRVRTKSVFGLSAASLFFKAGDVGASEKFACELLAQSWVEPYSAIKLRELLKTIWHAQTLSSASAMDALDIRILPPDKSSAIKLISAPEVYNATYRLFAFAASLQDKAQACFDKIQWIGRQFAATLSITPAEARSFSFRVESVVLDNLFEGLLGSADKATAFRRGAMVRVVRGLHRCMSATFNGDLGNPMSSEYTTGMNANMSKAVMDLYGQAGGPIEFTPSWSSAYPVPDDIRAIGVIRYDDDVVQTASKIYGAQKKTPRAGELSSVSGVVIGLKDKKDGDHQLDLLDALGSDAYNDRGQDAEQSPDDMPFDEDCVVTIEASRSAPRSVRKVHVSLSEQDYKMACDAHRDKKFVSAKGLLKFRSGKWILDPCQEFRVL